MTAEQTSNRVKEATPLTRLAHPNPNFPLLGPEIEATIGDELAAEYYETRAAAIEAENIDPFRYGYEPPIWAFVDDCLCDGKEICLVDYPGILPPDFERSKAEQIKLIGRRELMIGGSNRSTKTNYGCKKCVKIEVEKDGARGWSFHESARESIARQQPVFWHYLPPEYKNQLTGRLRQGPITAVGYSQKNGFADATYVLPNRSQHWFFNYEMDVEKLEGEQLDVALFDEKAPVPFLKTTRYRVLDRKGLIIVAFTPIDDGFTAAYNEYDIGSSTVLEVDAPLLPIKRPVDGGRRPVAGASVDGASVAGASVDGMEIVGYKKVPRVKKAGPGSEGDVKAVMVYFHITDNPYFDKQSLYEQLDGANEEKILARAYGVATKPSLNQFNYRENVHKISLNRFGEIVKAFPNGPRRHLVDPCSGRNWFMIWTYHPAPKKVIIYREWPSFGHLGAYIPGIGDPGPWAVPGNAADGDKGPGQKPFKWGLEQYAREILRLEGWTDDEIGKCLAGDLGEPANGEQIFERWMDSRYGNAAKQDREGSTTLIQQMYDLHMDFIAMTGEKKILEVNDGSIDMINQALSYDEKTPIGKYSATLARMNEPNLLVTENCPNVLYALQNWTGKDGAKGACKDPIDDIRGIFLSELDYVDRELMRPVVHPHFQR